MRGEDAAMVDTAGEGEVDVKESEVDMGGERDWSTVSTSIDRHTALR